MCNSKIKIFLSLSLVYFLSVCSSFAQSNEQLAIRNITEENGLSDNDVRCIYKDKNEFVWVGTASGLNLINGSDITVYKHNPADSNTISDNYITAIADAGSGLIWIGTRKGLNLLDPVTNTFTTYSLHAGDINHNDVIGCLAIDSKSNLFIGTFSGLFFLDHQTKKITPVHIPGNKNDSFKNNRITCLAIDSSGILWITTFNGLWSLNTKSNQVTHEIGTNNSPLSNGLFTYLIIDHSGKIWIGTWEDGLKEFDPAMKKIITHQYDKVIKSLAEIKQNNNSYLLLVNGISTAFDPLKNTFLHPAFNANDTRKFEVDNLYTSGDGWLWIGEIGRAHV